MKKTILLILLTTPFFLNAKAINPCPSSNDSTEVLRVYRNPSNNFTRIEFYLADKGMVNVQVINATGRLIESIPKEFEKDGLTILELDTTLYKSGVYFVRVGKNMMRFLIG